MIIKNKYIPFGRFDYISLWPFIVVKKDMDEVDENHERIHLAQQAECFIVGFLAMFIIGSKWYFLPLSYFSFYAVYVLNWIVEGVKMLFGGDKKAYKDIWFEKEAYDHEEYSRYLAIRKPFAWLKYILRIN